MTTKENFLNEKYINIQQLLELLNFKKTSRTALLMYYKHWLLPKPIRGSYTKLWIKEDVLAWKTAFDKWKAKKIPSWQFGILVSELYKARKFK